MRARPAADRRGAPPALLLAAGALLALGAACRSPPAPADPGASLRAALAARPGPRAGGPRFPAHVDRIGEDPRFARLGEGLWQRRDAAGDTVVRTAHVRVVTRASAAAAVETARAAEAHVARLYAGVGEALDLRFPARALPVRVYPTRGEFAARRDEVPATAPTWGAFYEASTGTVHVCLEPAPRGGLSLLADLRHEVTHQVLDLSTPPAGRARLFAEGPFWLWEAFAVWTEGRADPPGPGLRRERFARRLARGDVTPLGVLATLRPDAFEGRHYDQCAPLMDFLMADGVPGSRAGVLAVLRAALHGAREARPLAARLGLGLEEIERRWRAALGPGGPAPEAGEPP